MLSNNEYKGNRKSDNKFLFWFRTILISTVIFIIIYFSYYEIIRSGFFHMQGHNMMMMRSTPVVQNEEPAKTDEVLNDNTLTVLKDKPSLERGKEIFDTNCAACHRADAGGLVGPNLTDDYWINGGGIKNIVKTIANGVPEKGMISWRGMLNRKQMQETASYIISLHGTNPANPKPPQGEKYNGE